MSVQEAAVALLQKALFYVGIDWAAETHAVCVLEATGRIRAEFTIGHTAAGFVDLLRRPGRLSGDPAEVAVGIERPDGRLVDALLEAGYPVVPVSPNAIKTWREGEVSCLLLLRRCRRRPWWLPLMSGRTVSRSR